MALIWKPVDVDRLPLITDVITGFKHWVIRQKPETNKAILQKTESVLAHLRRAQ